MTRSILRFLYHLTPLLLFTASTLYAVPPIQGIIPKPYTFIPKSGTFKLDRHTQILYDTPLCSKARIYLQSHLGYTLPSGTPTHTSGQILFHYAPRSVTQSEGYILDIDTKQIRIEARDAAGFFYGIITLMQLTDPNIWDSSKINPSHSWYIQACHIEDHPYFKWRGMMLDVSRNFFCVAYIKKFLDRMAQYKLNRFHWHLTDDEGWRIEIKHYPKLTSIGAVRGPGTQLPFSFFPAMRGRKDRVQRGFYSQKEIKEIVAYAHARAIEVIPEIDMPGHAKAALTAYANLLSDPHDRSSYRSIQHIRNNTVNPAIESTYTFLDHVIAEVSRLFPSAYIHLGGDEIPKGAWQGSPAVHKLMQQRHLKNLQQVKNYFFERVDAILKKHGKKMLTWQEVLQGSPMLHNEDMVVAWKSPKAGYRAIEKHHNTIMAPVQYLYFDQQYKRAKGEPGQKWSTPVSLKKVYSFRPKRTCCLKGVEACLWSETLLDEHIADYLAWPRALALCEIAWSAPEHRQWHSFKKRMQQFALPRLKAQHVHYRPVK